MKNLLYLSIALAALSFASCTGDDEPTTKRPIGQLDPTAMIALNGKPTRSLSEALPAIEVVRTAVNLHFKLSYDAMNRLIPEVKDAARGFAPGTRDLENVRLLMRGTDIITQYGYLTKSFLYGRDYVIVGHKDGENYNGKDDLDTTAYIPNALILAAREKIEKAYADSNYTEVYRLFNEAFTFTPCTAEEWRKLETEGKQ